MNLAETLLAGLLSGIGGGAVLWTFATNAWLERRKAEWNKQLEAFKDSLTTEQRRLQTQLDSALFVTRSHFEVELNAMREVHQCLAKVKLSLRALNPIDSRDEKQATERSDQVEQLRTSTTAYFSKLEEWAAFLEPDLYDYFEQAFYGAEAEWKRFIFGSTPTQADLNHKQFFTNYQKSCQETRDRLKKLAILHGPRSNHP